MEVGDDAVSVKSGLHWKTLKKVQFDLKSTNSRNWDISNSLDDSAFTLGENNFQWQTGLVGISV